MDKKPAPNPKIIRAAPTLILVGMCVSAALGVYGAQNLDDDKFFDPNNPAERDIEKMLEKKNTLKDK